MKRLKQRLNDAWLVLCGDVDINYLRNAPTHLKIHTETKTGRENAILVDMTGSALRNFAALNDNVAKFEYASLTGNAIVFCLDYKSK